MDIDKLIVEVLQKLAKVEALMETDLKSVKQDVETISSKFDKLNEKVNKVDELEVKHSSLEDRVEKLENSNTWLLRTVGGILLGGAIYVIFGLQ